jgi:hypothetical protein
VFGIFKIKSMLLGLLLALPPVAAWIMRSPDTAAVHSGPPQQETVAPAEPAVQVPVEVVSKGSSPEWVYVEVPAQAVPEPGSVLMVTLSSLLLLRRQRPAGK